MKSSETNIVPGTIVLDTAFKYKEDGAGTGYKFVVLLNDGSCGYYLGVKTTSRHHWPKKGTTKGCQNKDDYPNFYIPGCPEFSRPTWILLDEYRAYSESRMAERLASGRLRLKGTLDIEIVKELLRCACYSIDIKGYQEKIVMASLVAINLGSKPRSTTKRPS